MTFDGDKITAVRMLQQPNHPQTTAAVPKLIAETLQAQSADIDTVSGATITSDGYKESLQAAIDARALTVHRVEHVMGFPVSLRVDDEGVPESAADGRLRLAARGRRAVQPVQARQRGVPAGPGRAAPSPARTSPRSSACARSTGSRPAAPSTYGCPAAASTPARW